jgi:hypothetical protein
MSHSVLSATIIVLVHNWATFSRVGAQHLSILPAQALSPYFSFDHRLQYTQLFFVLIKITNTPPGDLTQNQHKFRTHAFEIQSQKICI